MYRLLCNRTVQGNSKGHGSTVPKIKYKGGNGMKVILTQDIKGVGKKDQIINSSDRLC